MPASDAAREMLPLVAREQRDQVVALEALDERGLRFLERQLEHVGVDGRGVGRVVAVGRRLARRAAAPSPRSASADVAERQRALDHVAQLAHVARPVVALELRRAAPATARSCRAPSCSANHVASAGMSALRSRSGGTWRRDDREPVVQVLAELAGA